MAKIRTRNSKMGLIKPNSVIIARNGIKSETPVMMDMICSRTAEGMKTIHLWTAANKKNLLDWDSLKSH